MVEGPTPRRWRRILLIGMGVLAFLVLAAVLVPLLLPSIAVRRQVEAALSKRFGGRPVRVASADFRWGRGLLVTGLEVGRREGEGEALLARAERLDVRFSPLDTARAAAGADVPLQALRIRGLEVWLTVDRQGRWNVEDLGGSGPDASGGLRARNVQVLDATVHVENRALGRTVQLTGVQASLGELVTTGQGYATFAAQVAGAKPGRIVFTATTNTADFADRSRLSGSLKAEWEDVAWSEALGMVQADARLARLLSRTSGRLSATFGPEAWQVEGAVEGRDLALADLGEDATIPQVVLGFQVRRSAADAPIDVDLVKFSAPGINLHLEGGRVRIVGSEIREADLVARTTLAWGPLVQTIAPLARLAERFERLDGSAGLVVRLAGTPDGLRLTGTLDLKDTRAIWPGVVRKEVNQGLVLDFEADAARDGAAPALRRATVRSDSARLSLAGRLPLPAPGGAWSLADASLEASATVADLGALAAQAPLLRRVLGGAETAGQAEARLVLAPQTREGQTALVATFSADLTQAGFASARREAKPVGMTAQLEGSAVVANDLGRASLETLRLRIDKAAVAWAGQAEWRAPIEGETSATGRFSGTVSVEGIESVGAILYPDRFSGEAAPVSGSAAIAVDLALREGRLEGMVEADLGAAAVRAGDYFVKPAGRDARARLTGRWTPPGAPGPAGEAGLLKGRAVLALPGAEVTIAGQSQLRFAVTTAEANPDGRSFTADVVGPVARVDVTAEAQDLGQALPLVPVLAQRVAGRLKGSAQATLRLIAVPKNLSLAASADLTDADVRFEGALMKARGMALEVRASAEIMPAPESENAPAFLCETKAEGRLGRSAMRLDGQVRLLAPETLSALGSLEQAEALVTNAALDVQATVEHEAALREAVPCLRPLYDWCNLEGVTALGATFRGTPLAGAVHLDASATDCRILQSRRAGIAKPAGVPATVALDLRFGQVPGEIVLEGLSVRLADGEIQASGRLFYDDPRLRRLAAPSAWLLRAKGRVPDMAAVAALFPARVADLQPTGGVTFDLSAAADSCGGALERCEVSFREAALMWLDRRIGLDGPISYDGARLATDGLHLAAGRTDVTLVAYVTDPGGAPQGSVFIRGKTVALEEVQTLVEETSERLSARASGPSAGGEAAAIVPVEETSARLARSVRQLLARARISGDIQLGEVTLSVKELGARYTLLGLATEWRLGDRRFDVPHFECDLNEGKVAGKLLLDFAEEPPVLSVAYTARDLAMGENLKPFIDRTFPGMQVFGRFTHTEVLTQELAEGSVPLGRGETVLTDGLLEGPGAPDYITALLPGLRLTTYRFNRMSNVFEHQPNGDVENRMIFDGQQYDIFMFGVSHADGTIKYTLGVDLSVSLGSQVWSRTLDQGKIPLMYYTGRIVGTQYVPPGPEIAYILPHELAYDVFVKRNLLFQLLAHLGEKPPDLGNPPPPPGRAPTTPEP